MTDGKMFMVLQKILQPAVKNARTKGFGSDILLGCLKCLKTLEAYHSQRMCKLELCGDFISYLQAIFDQM